MSTFRDHRKKKNLSLIANKLYQQSKTLISLKDLLFRFVPNFLRLHQELPRGDEPWGWGTSIQFPGHRREGEIPRDWYLANASWQRDKENRGRAGVTLEFPTGRAIYAKTLWKSYHARDLDRLATRVITALQSRVFRSGDKKFPRQLRLRHSRARWRARWKIALPSPSPRRNFAKLQHISRWIVITESRSPRPENEGIRARRRHNCDELESDPRAGRLLLLSLLLLVINREVGSRKIRWTLCSLALSLPLSPSSPSLCRLPERDLIFYPSASFICRRQSSARRPRDKSLIFLAIQDTIALSAHCIALGSPRLC